MKAMALSVIFLGVVSISLLATVPIGFVLDRSGARSLGLSWVTTQGTIWDGQVSGLQFEDQPIGTARLKLTASSLLHGEIGYRLAVEGPAGKGEGTISVGRSRLTVQALTGLVRLAELTRLVVDVREIGGVVDIDVKDLVFREGACSSATGTVTTNIVARAAQTYGRDFGAMEGQIRCDNGMLLVPLAVTSEAGDDVALDVRIGLKEALSANARVNTQDPDFAVALALLGFSEVDGTYVYHRELRPVGG